MTLGARLQELRLRHGMSQDALADKLGVSRQAVSKWERDEATPDLDKIIKLSELYGISLDALLKEEPQPAKTQQTPPHPHKADWNRILTWGGLLGGGAMVVWGLTNAVGLMAYEQIASNMLSGAVNVMGVTMTGEAQNMFSQFLPTSQILWVAPVAKLLIGAALIGLGLWARKKGRTQA